MAASSNDAARVARVAVSKDDIVRTCGPSGCSEYISSRRDWAWGVSVLTLSELPLCCEQVVVVLTSKHLRDKCSSFHEELYSKLQTHENQLRLGISVL
jgi:hypothetical protein